MVGGRSSAGGTAIILGEQEGWDGVKRGEAIV